MTKRTPENIEITRNYIENNHATGTRTALRGMNVDFRRGTLRTILKEDLNMYPYKNQQELHLSVGSKAERVRFAQHFLRTFTGNNANDEKLRNLWVSDESFFDLNPNINKQNDREWHTKGENPKVAKIYKQHPQRLMVWATFSKRGFLLVILEENRMNAERYQRLLQEDLQPFLQERGYADAAWFQQDGAPAHTAHDTMEYIVQAFNGRILSKR